MTYKPLPKLVVILGPTACGKTKLAVKLAKIFNGEIVSADSRQVYQGLDIGTGKDLKEYGNIPHHLIDVASPKKQFSLAEYQKLAYKAINDIIKRGKVPLLVGGSGLYLQSVIDGYQLADVKPDIKLRKYLNMRTLEQLQKLAKQYKIQLNESDYKNKRRLIRVIEKAICEKRYAKSDIQSAKYNCLILGIKYPKKVIDKRIDERLMHRLEKEKMIDEVKKLRRNRVSWKRLDDFGLEYRYITKYLCQEISYNEMVKQLSIAIHQFAKRQLTWFSAHGGSAFGGKKMDRINWLKNLTQAKKLINNFLVF
jgi:tRNA dimethylallyltransferase